MLPEEEEQQQREEVEKEEEEKKKTTYTMKNEGKKEIEIQSIKILGLPF